MSDLKVLQITKFYPPHPGGIESVTCDLTVGLNERGVLCDVLCANDSRPTVIDIMKEGYRVSRMANYGNFFSTSLAPSIVSELKRRWKDYDLLHVHFPDPLSALALFLVKPKNKIVIHWHSDIIRQKKLLKIYLPLLNWVLRRADLIIGTSPQYVNASSQLRAFLPKTVSIPIGIRTDHLQYSPHSISNIKKRFGEKKLVFALGRLVYYKGFEYLIAAAREISDDAVILIGGTGGLDGKLRRLIQSEGVGTKVELLGMISPDDLGSYFKSCDLFCLPSIERSEAFGVVQLEAMALGKPVVSTNIAGSGVNWVNKNGETGITVAPKDSSALALAINRLLMDNTLYQQYAGAAYSRFNQFFRHETMVDKVMAVYEKLQGKQ